jgi:hypothetical protein
MLAAGTVAWAITFTTLAVGCENREETAVCKASSWWSLVMLLLAVDLPIVGGWALARHNRRRGWLAICLLALGAAAAIVTWSLVWGSEDAG